MKSCHPFVLSTGGYNAILVYKIGEATPSEPTPAPADEPTPAPVDEPTPAPVDEPTPAPVDTSGPSNGDGYESLGCFADNQPNSGGKKVRIMGGKTSSESMTPEVSYSCCALFPAALVIVFGACSTPIIQPAGGSRTLPFTWIF